MTAPVDRFKDAKELRNTDKYKLEYHADQNVATLTIRKTENMDAGRYRLEAHNVNGDAETACRLSVSGRFSKSLLFGRHSKTLLSIVHWKLVFPFTHNIFFF